MDLPLPRRKTTWKDSAWWRATSQSAVSGVLMMAVALPILAWLVAQLKGLTPLALDPRAIVRELAEGAVLMMPYLWFYFFALERISKQRRDNFSSSDNFSPSIDRR